MREKAHEAACQRGMIAFPYFGGKNRWAQQIIALFPEHGHYIEPFGGSAAILLNKAPSQIETYNDLDSDVATFFKVLREQPEDLLRALQLTPWSREEFNLSRSGELVDPLEQARRFYIRIRQGFNALPRLHSNGWKHSILASARSQNCPETWLASLDSLELVAQRFLTIQIENRPALEIIHAYDHEDCFMYLDPPYVLSARSAKSSHNQNLAYTHEMEDADHRALAAALQNIKSKCMVSGYRCELYDELFKDWLAIDFEAKRINSSKAFRTETVWLNYEPSVMQQSLGIQVDQPLKFTDLTGAPL